MNPTTTIELSSPYLVFLGDIKNEVYAKTGYGVVQWRRDLCVAQYRLQGCTIDLGLPDMTPADAAKCGARTRAKPPIDAE